MSPIVQVAEILTPHDIYRKMWRARASLAWMRGSECMSRFVCVLVAMLSAACSEGTPAPSEDAGEAVVVKSAGLPFGASCAAHDECESAACMQVEQWVEGSARFCTQPCNPEATEVFESRTELMCPEDYACTRSDGGFCLPTIPA